MKKAISTLLGAAAIILFAPALVGAALPQAIRFQGYLTASGTPINAPTLMTLSLYSLNLARNNPVWRGPQPEIPVNGGSYDIQMGAVVPITAPLYIPFWQGVKVGTDAEIAPLQPRATSGYAFTAPNGSSVGPGNDSTVDKVAGNLTMVVKTVLGTSVAMVLIIFFLGFILATLP